MTIKVKDLQHDKMKDVARPLGQVRGLSSVVPSPLVGSPSSGCSVLSAVGGPWSNSAPYMALGPESFTTAHQFEDVLFFVEGDIKVGSGPLLDANGAARKTAVEALLAHYRKRGDTFVEDLHGSFRLALWDIEKQRLLLASDPFGTRSLYYCAVNGTLVFAPKVSSIATLPVISKEIDPNVLYFFLNHSFIPAPYTIYRNIRRLEPAEYLRWYNGSATTRQYWDLAYDEDHDVRTDTAADSIRSSVEHSVRDLLDAQNLTANDVGAFLSGGTDSSTVLGLMTRVGKGRVKTFSVGFAEEGYNEIHYARIAAAHFNAEAHETFVNADDALAAVPVLAANFDEPFGNASAIPTYFCLRTAADAGVRVMFAGDGGDELFAGNQRYLEEKRFLPFDVLPQALQTLSVSLSGALPGSFPFGKIKRYVERASERNPARFFHYQLYVRQQIAKLLTKEFIQRIDEDFPLFMPCHHYEKVKFAAPLNRLLYMDLKMCIADNDLFKVNRMAEASGVKVCYPYLDRNLAELTGKIPAHLKLRGFHKRYIFKKAFKELLPDEILRKKKHGFGLPVARWLRGHAGFRNLARSLLLDTKPLQRGYFNRSGLEALLGKHDSEPSDYYGPFIWNLMMFELWQQEYRDR